MIKQQVQQGAKAESQKASKKKDYFYEFKSDDQGI